MKARDVLKLGFIVAISGGCLDPVGPRTSTDYGLELELVVPRDTVIVGSRFDLAVLLRNSGMRPMTLSGGGCLARHTVRLRGREVWFPATGGDLVCGASIWRLPLAPGEETESVITTQATLPESVDLPADFTVETEFFFYLTVGEETIRPNPRLGDRFVIGRFP